MGRRGPPPKPTALKILEGNPGKTKIQDTGEPVPNAPVSVPKPPPRLLPEAKKEWKRLVRPLIALGVLTEVDLDAFAELCQNYAYYRSVDRKILENGEDGAFLLMVTPSGYEQQHPYLALRRQYYESWRRGLADFGLTPASRARICVGNSAKEAEEDDPLAAVLNGNWRA